MTMILDQTGQTFMLEHICVYIGQEIVANSKSDYAGLPGIVTEIRDGEDKETANPSVDIYCDFYLPDNSFFFKQRADDICLDQVIMAPDMIEPKAQYQINPAETQFYVLACHIDSDDEHDTEPLCVSSDIERLKAAFERHKRFNRCFTERCGEAFSLDGFTVSEDDAGNCKYSWTASSAATYVEYSIDTIPFIFE